MFTWADIFVRMCLFAELVSVTHMISQIEDFFQNSWNSSCIPNGCVKTFPLFLPDYIHSSSFEVKIGNTFIRFLMIVFRLQWLRKSMQITALEILQSAQKRVSFLMLRSSFGVSQGGWLGLRNCWRKCGKDGGSLRNWWSPVTSRVTFKYDQILNDVTNRFRKEGWVKQSLS